MAKILTVKTVFIQDIELKHNHIYEVRYKDQYNDWVTKTGRVVSIQEDSFKLDISKQYYAESVTVPLKEEKIDSIKKITDSE